MPAGRILRLGGIWPRHRRGFGPSRVGPASGNITGGGLRSPNGATPTAAAPLRLAAGNVIAWSIASAFVVLLFAVLLGGGDSHDDDSDSLRSAVVVTAAGHHAAAQICSASAFGALWISTALAALANSESRHHVTGSLVAMGCATIGFVGSVSTAAWQDAFSPPTDEQQITLWPVLSLASWCLSSLLATQLVWESADNASSSSLLAGIMSIAMLLALGIGAALGRGGVRYGCVAASGLFYVVLGALHWRWLTGPSETNRGLDRKKQHQEHQTRRAAKYLFVAIETVFPVGMLLRLCAPALGSNGDGAQWAVAAVYIHVAGDVLAKSALCALVAQGVLIPRVEQKHQQAKQKAQSLMQQLADLTTSKSSFSTALSSRLIDPVHKIVSLSQSMLHSYGADMPSQCRQSMLTMTKLGKTYRALLEHVLDAPRPSHISSLQTDLSRPGSELETDERLVDLKQLVQEVMHILEPKVGIRTTVVIDLPEGISGVCGARVSIMEALFNVLGHALKMSKRGTMTVTAKNIPDRVHIDIILEGTHLREEEMEAAHSQSDSSASLAEAKRLISALGGDLIEQEVSDGQACFSVLLMSRRCSLSTLKGPSQLSQTQPPPDLAHSSLVSVAVEDSAPPASKTVHAWTSGVAAKSVARKLKQNTQRRKMASAAVLPVAQSTMDLPTNSSNIGVLTSKWIQNKRRPSQCSVHELNSDDLLEIYLIGGSQADVAACSSFVAGSIYSLSTARTVPDAIAAIQMRSAEGRGAPASLPSVFLVDYAQYRDCTKDVLSDLRLLSPSRELPLVIICSSEFSYETTIRADVNAEGCDFIRRPLDIPELRVRLLNQMHSSMMALQQPTSSSWSEQLLNDILPSSVIQRLSAGQRLIADELDQVTVIFSDIVGFTELTSTTGTTAIIDMLDQLFCKMDAVTDRFGVHKVETIGDCYMIVCGHDARTRMDHALVAVHVAMAMVDVASQVQRPDGEPLQVRVGLHSGSAYAGVVGYKGPRYCLFGDTVNTASRMESNSFPMCVHMSKATYDLVAVSSLAHSLEFMEISGRTIKGKGEMTTYLLKWGAWKQAAERLERQDSLPPENERSNKRICVVDLTPTTTARASLVSDVMIQSKRSSARGSSTNMVDGADLPVAVLAMNPGLPMGLTGHSRDHQQPLGRGRGSSVSLL